MNPDQQILASCPPDQQVAVLVQVDASGSSRSDDIDRDYLRIIEQLTRRTAICGGRLTVTAFSDSSGSTQTIFDQELQLHGATDNARLRRAEGAVGDAMEVIQANYPDAMAAAQGSGTDVIGMYRLASEHLAQLPGHRLELMILTDGLSNRNVDLNGMLDIEATRALADTVTVPLLPGASVTVAGLGRVAGDPLPSQAVEAITVFYNQLCKRTEAEVCLAVTDWR